MPRRHSTVSTLLRSLGVGWFSGRGTGECPVNAVVNALGWPQPQVSKHLGVLRKVGLVNVRREGRLRLYSVNGEQLKPIHDWVITFERFWQHQLNRIKQLAEQKAKAANQPLKNNPNPEE